MPASEKAQQLRALVRLISDAAEDIIKEWEVEDSAPPTSKDAPRLPSWELYNARRTFIGACGMGVDLVHDPQTRLTEVAASYMNSQALRVAAETRIADILDGVDPSEGLSIQKISQRVGIQDKDLTRVLRSLCTLHIFNEVKEDHYANNATSRYLVKNEHLRCWLLVHSAEAFSATEKLPAALYDSLQRSGNSLRKSAFQIAYGIDADFWHWLEEMVERPDGTLGPRPEREVWRTGMWGFGLQHIQAPAVCDDYPWNELGPCTVVDIGAGIGGMSLELAKRYPQLRFVVEDTAPVLLHAKAVWERELPDVIATGRVQLMAHNFFEAQPVKGADIYVLRHIFHDWDDSECVAILTHLRAAMEPSSLVLIADNVMHSTAGTPHLKAAPPPLPPNYGQAHTFANIHDLLMFVMFMGGERTAEQLDVLAAQAGLKVTKVWECRGLTSITELRRDDYTA
ncbi:S-adenosyl-L-methionine-dependent methyltransferase [Wolfiporia cocos MD-104 SS10]|uniref:S-adenosyl-L-methionine-dependent methyltransferase n=1 Tax=Wolfiporia cocos (strain MD-104) TaxID=742152 RepID=A0A2H3JN68_WOLCO|nr:S-adenosyl-L-methionine-dependent methyltransferase [Wolfiporia cocos MD-104 SS10]